jgi:hypothetical protein
VRRAGSAPSLARRAIAGHSESVDQPSSANAQFFRAFPYGGSEGVPGSEVSTAAPQEGSRKITKSALCFCGCRRSGRCFAACCTAAFAFWTVSASAPLGLEDEFPMLAWPKMFPTFKLLPKTCEKTFTNENLLPVF